MDFPAVQDWNVWRKMQKLPKLFENNRIWADGITKSNPSFFKELSKQQTPEYLWIGCSDSRVPANDIVGLMPGELFVHRNVGNLVIHTDMNCLSVLQFAVDILKVRHVIVCGHYGCGGVKTALDDCSHGLIDNWLRHICDIYSRKSSEFAGISDPEKRMDLLCELNVAEQVINVGNTTIVKDAWSRGQELAVHGWIYGISDGLLKDLNTCLASTRDLENFLRRG